MPWAGFDWDTRDNFKVAKFARDIFYLVPPSLMFFVPFLFQGRTAWPFWANFGAGLALMADAMLGLCFLLK